MIIPGNHEFYAYDDVTKRGDSWQYMFRKNIGYYYNKVVRIDDGKPIMVEKKSGRKFPLVFYHFQNLLILCFVQNSAFLPHFQNIYGIIIY